MTRQVRIGRLFLEANNHFALVTIVGALALSHSFATAQASLSDDAKSVFDRIWRHATLWKDPNSGNYFALSGRLQLESAWFSADEDKLSEGAESDYSELQWRRFRFGFKGAFGGFEAALEAALNLNNDLDDLYNSLTDAYLGYSTGKAFKVKLLKQSAGFTLDGATSSKKLLTLQRNNLTNNLWFTDEYFTGLHVGGTVDKRLSYKAGIFSGEDENEIKFGDLGYFSLLSLGYNFAQGLNMDDALVRIDYVYNDKDVDDPEVEEGSGTPDLEHVLTLATKWQKGGLGLWTDLSAGQGLGSQSDLWGLVLMPFYSFNSHHQAVLRYTYLSSDDDNGIRAGRYERELIEGRGDRYNEIYAGYNLFFYGHKLKWQTGLQYTTMDDDADDGGEYAGWGLTTGLRMYWY